jgi:hypothetical protein
MAVIVAAVQDLLSGARRAAEKFLFQDDNDFWRYVPAPDSIHQF